MISGFRSDRLHEKEDGMHGAAQVVLFGSKSTNENDLVLDSCAGSGTTGIAARNLNRNFILIEKDENYYNLILKRLEIKSSKKLA